MGFQKISETKKLVSNREKSVPSTFQNSFHESQEDRYMVCETLWGQTSVSKTWKIEIIAISTICFIFLLHFTVQ